MTAVCAAHSSRHLLCVALTSNHAFSGAIGIERDVELTVKLLKAQGHEVVTVVATEHLHCRR